MIEHVEPVVVSNASGILTCIPRRGSASSHSTSIIRLGFVYQLGFIQGRHITDNINTLHMSLKLISKIKSNENIILINQEKVYDKISWKHLHHVIIPFGLARNFDIY